MKRFWVFLSVLVLMASAVNATSVKVSWEASPVEENVFQYFVERSAAGAAFDSAGVTSDTIYYDSTLGYDIVYAYRIFAYNGLYSPSSNVVSGFFSSTNVSPWLGTMTIGSLDFVSGGNYSLCASVEIPVEKLVFQYKIAGQDTFALYAEAIAEPDSMTWCAVFEDLLPDTEYIFRTVAWQVPETMTAFYPDTFRTIVAPSPPHIRIRIGQE